MKPTQPLTPENEAAIRDHVSVNREALRRAVGTVARQCKGLLMGDIGVGMDPAVEDPMRRWWAKVTIQGGRAGTQIISEGHASALDALDALGPKIHATLRARRRR